MADRPEGFTITELWAFVSRSEDNDRDEGVVAHLIGNTWMPLVAADPDRIESLRPYAQEAADITGRTISLIHFDRRQHIETITPKGTP